MRNFSHFLNGAFKRLISRFRRDLRLQIAFFYLLFVVPVIIVGFFFGSSINARLQADVMATDLALARSIAQETELNLTNARFAVQELARYAEFGGTQPQDLEDLYDKYLGTQSLVNPVSLLGGWWIIENPTPLGVDVIPPEAFPSRDYLQRTELSHFSVSGGWRSSISRTPVATSVAPLWDELGNVFGVVVSNIKLDALSQALENLLNEYQANTNYGISALVVDGSRRIVMHPDRSFLLRSTADFPTSVVTDVLRGRSGSQVHSQPGEPEMLYSYAPISGTDWGVIVTRPTEIAFATANAFSRSMLIVVAIFLGVGISFWVGLSRQVIWPLEKLAVFGSAISRNEKLSRQQQDELGNLAARPDQVGHLTDTLVQMEADIDARLNELATLLQTSAAVVSTLENQVVLNRILEQVERLLDVKMSAIVALDRRDGTFRAQASRGISSGHAAQLTVNPLDTESIILRALRNRAPVHIDDTESASAFKGVKMRAQEAGYRSSLAIPLQTLYAPPSALLIFRAEPHIFSEREISLLTNFANHAAMAIENATLYARSDMQLQEQTRRLEALIQSLNEGLILENLDGKVVYANRQISILVDRPIQEIVGASVSEVVPGSLGFMA